MSPSFVAGARLGLTVAGESEPWRNYMSSGRSFMQGLAAIAALNKVSDATHTLTAGFATEALLKALLSFRGVSERELASSRLGHDLLALWAEGWALNAVSDPQAPEWMERLQSFHFRNDPKSKHRFFIRYQSGGGLYSLPAVSEVQTGIIALEQYVSSTLGGT
jgi:hypothetical protein